MKRQYNTRERLLRESAGCCIYCGHPLTEDTMETDHIVPRSKGGSGDISNKVCACPQCNAAKADMDVADFIGTMPYKKQRAYENRLMSLFEQGRLSARKWDILDPIVPRAHPDRAQTDKVAECPCWQIFCYLCGEFY
ncbi:MAG: HNH endonuclease [Bacteroidales bacterium]|nr:HNH endonuclease [Bacteroidales bacterium]